MIVLLTMRTHAAPLLLAGGGIYTSAKALLNPSRY